MNDGEIIEMVCKKAGGMRALGRTLGIAYQNIQGWKEIPAHYIIPIEEKIGIPRQQLRPELYARRRRKKTVRG
jgi:DNA-binding transcriptional regulator YdaS (Cro superfamily)